MMMFYFSFRFAVSSDADAVEEGGGGLGTVWLLEGASGGDGESYFEPEG